MDIILLVIGFLLILIGIAGSLLPILPGPLASWFGLLFLYLTKTIPTDWTFLIITLIVAIIITILDNFIPIIGTKKFGGTKFGVIGATLGLVIGLFFGPIGIILGPFLGAFIGELLKDSKNSNKALKAAVGSFIGFLTSTVLKLVVSVLFAVVYFSVFWEYKSAFFNISL